MARYKKISFKYYHAIGKTVQEFSEYLDEDGVLRFPIKIRINFNRQNTAITLNDKRYSKEDFKSLTKRIKNGYTSEEFDDLENDIEKVVRLEFKIAEDFYTLKGFSWRYKVLYTGDLFLAANPYDAILKKLDNDRKEVNSYLFYPQQKTKLTGQEVNLFEYYHLCKIFDNDIHLKLSNNKDLIIASYLFYLKYYEKGIKTVSYTVLDWINSLKKDFYNFLSNPKLVEKKMKDFRNFTTNPLLNDFKFKKNNIDSYVKIIDDSIAKTIRDEIRHSINDAIRTDSIRFKK